MGGHFPSNHNPKVFGGIPLLPETWKGGDLTLSKSVNAKVFEVYFEVQFEKKYL